MEQQPRLRADKKVLLRIPGIGEITAHEFLGEMPDGEQFNSTQSMAAYAGLSPRQHSSGTSVQKRTRLSETGNSHLRRALAVPL